MTQLCDTFQDLARRVWSDREQGLRLGLDPGEPTFTEVLLLELGRKHRRAITIHKFTPRAEGKTYGADWEWWFVGGNRAWGMRVQAKKLDGKSLDYGGIDYPYGKKKRQVVKLLYAAIRDGLYPLYCFYNVDHPDLGVSPRPCPLAVADRSLWGCSIADGHLIRIQQQKKLWKVSDIAPICMPWHCLVCCPDIIHGFGAGPEPDGVRRWIEDTLLSRGDADVEDLPPVRPLRETPDYVQQMYRERSQQSEGLLESSGYGERDIAGAVLFRMRELMSPG